MVLKKSDSEPYRVWYPSEVFFRNSNYKNNDFYFSNSLNLAPLFWAENPSKYQGGNTYFMMHFWKLLKTHFTEKAKLETDPELKKWYQDEFNSLKLSSEELVLERKRKWEITPTEDEPPTKKVRYEDSNSEESVLLLSPFETMYQSSKLILEFLPKNDFLAFGTTSKKIQLAMKASRDHRYTVVLPQMDLTTELCRELFVEGPFRNALHIDLGHTQVSTPYSSEADKCLFLLPSNLESLILPKGPAINESFMRKILETYPNLTTFGVNGREIQELGALTILKTRHWKSLKLNKAFAWIISTPQFETLYMRLNYQRRVLQLLSEITSLEELDLSDNEILEDPFLYLYALPKLRKLNLSGNKIGRFPGFKQLLNQQDDDALCLQFSPLQLSKLIQNTTKREKWTHLTSLDLSRNAFRVQGEEKPIDFEFLQQFRHLESLNLSKNALKSSDLVALSALLNLKHLLLSENLLDDHDLESLKSIFTLN